MDQSDTYEILPHPNGWVVKHNGEVAGPYETKQAAFEAAASAAELVIAEGHAVELRVPAVGPPQG
jgi:hypothetical protein